MVALEASKKGKIIKLFTPDQVNVAIPHLFARIKIITGATIGVGDLFKTMSEEVFEFLMSIPAYAHLTIEEIVTAFRLNAAGKLGDRIEHFNQLITCDYIGKILERYVKLRAQLEDKKYSFQPDHQLEYKPEYNEQVMIESAREAYIKTKKVGLISESIYKILVRKGLLVLTIEERAAIKNKIISDMDAQAIQDGLNAMRVLRLLKEDAEKFDSIVQMDCRRLAVAKYFDKEQLEIEKLNNKKLKKDAKRTTNNSSN